MPRNTDVNGDARFDSDAHANDYYTLRSTLGSGPREIPLYGVIDSDDGYVAFCTSQEQADLIAAALDAYVTPEA